MSGRLIYLVSVAKSFPRAGLPPHVVLSPGTISLPSDRNLAVLALRRQGKTTLLQLLSRKLAPDQGEVFAYDDLSPVVNADPLFHPQLTGIENIRFIARAYGLDADLLLRGADALGAPALQLDKSLKGQDKALRRGLEAAVTFMLPFQCYLVDEIGQLDPLLVVNSLQLAARRRAGVIFTTSQPRIALQYAASAVILGSGALQFFSDVHEAIDMFEQQRRS